MAVKLFKLKVDVDTNVSTDLYPDIHQYFYEFDSDDLDEGVLTIPAAKFVDDEGEGVGSLVTVSENNGYYLLFINGVLQQYDLYEVAGTGAQVTIEDADTILPGTPITLIVTNFAPQSDTSATIVST